jgi:hypothetical protein
MDKDEIKRSVKKAKKLVKKAQTAHKVYKVAKTAVKVASTANKARKIAANPVYQLGKMTVGKALDWKGRLQSTQLGAGAAYKKLLPMPARLHLKIVGAAAKAAKKAYDHHQSKKKRDAHGRFA